MKKIYLFILAFSFGFYFVSAQNPVANFTASEDSVCATGLLNFTDQSSNAPTSWLWTFQGAVPASSTVQHPQNIFFAIPGNSTVKLVVSNSSGTDSISKIILVHPAARFPTFTTSEDTLFVNVDSSFASYKWYWDTLVIAGATEPFYVIIPDTCGSFSLGGVDTVTGCGIALGFTITCTGVHNLADVKTLNVYPNPAADQLTIHSSHPFDEDLTISIMNVPGDLIREERLKWSRDILLNVASLNAGIYFLQLKSESGKRNEEVCKAIAWLKKGYLKFP